MAKRKQRIYTKYQPELALSPRSSSGSKGKLLAVLLVAVGAAWWAASTGKIVLPGPLQNLVAGSDSDPAEESPPTHRGICRQFRA